MKLILATKEDWENANWVVRMFNLIFNILSLLILIVILMDWIGI